MRIILAAAALAGFAASNALETALLYLSFAEEKKLAKSLAKTQWLWTLARLYAGAFEQWKRHPTGFLTVILVINGTLSMLWCVLVLAHLGAHAWAPLAVGACLFVVGELFPKVAARKFPEFFILILILPFYGFFAVLGRVARPLVRPERHGRWRLPRSLRYPLSDQELKTLLADRELTQDLRPRSRFIVESLLEFSSRRVKEAMRPAAEVFVLDRRDISLKTVIERIAARPYSRIPVSSDGTLARTIGILYAKDLLFTFATSGLVNLDDLLRECPVVEESERLTSVMERFRRGAIHLALVKDKAGNAKGIISLEDILEEMVGEIKDEHT